MQRDMDTILWPFVTRLHIHELSVMRRVTAEAGSGVNANPYRLSMCWSIANVKNANCRESAVHP